MNPTSLRSLKRPHRCPRFARRGLSETLRQTNAEGVNSTFVTFPFIRRSRARGLDALQKERLLAHAVLRGRTKGYLHHPQLQRFRAQPSACRRDRGLSSLRSRGGRQSWLRVRSAKGQPGAWRWSYRRDPRQLEHEWLHLMSKLVMRDPATHIRLACVKRPQSHPIFRMARWRRDLE